VWRTGLEEAAKDVSIKNSKQIRPTSARGASGGRVDPKVGENDVEQLSSSRCTGSGGCSGGRQQHRGKTTYRSHGEDTSQQWRSKERDRGRER
jgi:hypothetical protein